MSSDPDDFEKQCVVDNLDKDVDIDMAWESGVEEYKNTKPEDLWHFLGLREQRAPFFSDVYDPNGIYDTTTPEGQKWLQKNGVVLALKWHQLVGGLKVLDNFLSHGFNSQLLADSVGLGKTIQLAFVISLLCYFRDHYKTNGKFPGKFGASRFHNCL